VVFVVVNGIFDGGGGTCGGYAFCGFSSMSLLLLVRSAYIRHTFSLYVVL